MRPLAIFLLTVATAAALALIYLWLGTTEGVPWGIAAILTGLIVVSVAWAARLSRER